MGSSAAVTGIAVMSGLGNTPAEHAAAMDVGGHGLRPLGGLLQVGPEFAELPGGWLRPRSPMADTGNRAYGHLHGYWVTSDAYHPLGLPDDGRGIARCLRLALDDLSGRGIAAICPHASGTKAHGQAERRALVDL